MSCRSLVYWTRYTENLNNIPRIREKWSYSQLNAAFKFCSHARKILFKKTVCIQKEKESKIEWDRNINVNWETPVTVSSELTVRCFYRRKAKNYFRHFSGRRLTIFKSNCGFLFLFFIIFWVDENKHRKTRMCRLC